MQNAVRGIKRWKMHERTKREDTMRRHHISLIGTPWRRKIGQEAMFRENRWKISILKESCKCSHWRTRHETNQSTNTPTKKGKWWQNYRIPEIMKKYQKQPEEKDILPKRVAIRLTADFSSVKMEFERLDLYLQRNNKRK